MWLYNREGLIQFGLQCEFALDELRRTRPDLCAPPATACSLARLSDARALRCRPPLHKGWRLDWKEFLEKDWSVRVARWRFQKAQNAARAKELAAALQRRREAEARVAASVAEGSYVGAERVTAFLRTQREARDRRRRRVGLTPHERFVAELDAELGLAPDNAAGSNINNAA